MDLIVGPWLWYAIALVLIVFEAMKPSGVFASMSVASAILGGLITAYPELTWQQQLGIYASITIVLSFIVIRIVAVIRKDEDIQPESSTMIGQEFQLKTPLQNSFGEIELDGVFWSLKGPDMKRDTAVRVVGIDGQMLAIMPISALAPKKEDEQAEDAIEETSTKA